MLPPKTPLSAPYYRLLHRLWRRGPDRTLGLFKELNLSRTLGAKLVAQMTDEGVAGIDGEVLGLRGDYGSVLGLHLGTGVVDAVLTDFAGNVLVTHSFGYPPPAGEPSALPEAITSSVATMEPFLRPPEVPPLRGLAVSLPGIVDPYRLVLVQSTPLGVTQALDLQETVGRPLGRPLSVENDANCCCWGEAAVHRGQRQGNFLSILAELRPYGLGEARTPYKNFAVGFGLYLNGSVYHGDRFSAGEFQSILKTNVAQRNQFSLTDEQMARSSVDPAIEDRVAQELARHAAFLVNTLNLDTVYVSWPHPGRAAEVLSLVRDEIRRNGSYHSQDAVVVEAPSLGYWAPAFGAAGLHLESLFQSADGPAPYSSQPRPGIFR